MVNGNVVNSTQISARCDRDWRSTLHSGAGRRVRGWKVARRPGRTPRGCGPLGGSCTAIALATAPAADCPRQRPSRNRWTSPPTLGRGWPVPSSTADPLALPATRPAAALQDDKVSPILLPNLQNLMSSSRALLLDGQLAIPPPCRCGRKSISLARRCGGPPRWHVRSCLRPRHHCHLLFLSTADRRLGCSNRTKPSDCR